MNRRTYIQRGALTVGALLGASASATATSDSPPAWDPDTAYTEGDEVTFDGYVWAAKWWTKGDEPGSDEWGPWNQLRPVDDGGGDGSLAAAITVRPSSPSVGESVTLDASASTGDIDGYEWTLPDQDDVTGPTPTVTFAAAGSVTVSLTVTGADGDTASADTTITVTDGEDAALTADTTLAEFLPSYQERHIPDVFLDFMPGENGAGGGVASVERATVNWTDAEKAAAFNVDLDAIRNTVRDGSLPFGALGSQALDWAQSFRSADTEVPDHAIAQLLPRLMLLPDETEPPTFQGSGRAAAWDETGGPVAATNDPGVFCQTQWPTDARGEADAEVEERDRVYLQAKTDPAWSDDFTYLDNYDSALLDTLQNNTHPVTGDPLGGDGFTATAPMELSTEIHGDSWFWYQVLLFKNTSPVPYHLDGAVVWWLGPSNFGKTMSAGAYNNEQRPRPGYGHPQRDIIEITLPDKRVPDAYSDVASSLSAYAVRLAYHDSPYNMRTAYPNQYWSLEVSVGEPLADKFDTAAKRQRAVDMIAATAHVELETDMDRNDDVVDAIELYNRVGN
ncbi:MULTISPECIES: PKD domain-containing protein [Halobacterium]|uniref:PKD domain-containing protein n=1 Tax=Halobacterium TaxID=2239 RepID=UPI001964EB6C|nr:MULTISPECIES: PKD domain-containing protein [Halobacterium]MDL0121609.1 PKD domain-containing protein [Halobacterium salinarum]QRY25414.1 PKD domain-containing protein [Halobacterium sp. BOL4-2]